MSIILFGNKSSILRYLGVLIVALFGYCSTCNAFCFYAGGINGTNTAPGAGSRPTMSPAFIIAGLLAPTNGDDSGTYNEWTYASASTPGVLLSDVTLVMPPLGVNSCGLVGPGGINSPDYKNKESWALYTPPAGASFVGNGYVMQSNVQGYGVRVSFPGSIFDAASSSLILAKGKTAALGPSGSMEGFSMRVSLVKTGPSSFSSPQTFDFRGISLGSFSARTFDGFIIDTPKPITLALDPSLSGRARINPPSCFLIMSNGAGPAVKQMNVRLDDVDVSEFSGIPGTGGALTTHDAENSFAFSCLGNMDNVPTVTFTTSVQGTTDGVGLPGSSSSIGIQILMNGLPIKFGYPYANLPIVFNGQHYSQMNLGSFSHDDGASWESTKVDSSSAGVPLTFRYYKISSPLVAGPITINYTVTLNIL